MKKTLIVLAIFITAGAGVWKINSRLNFSPPPTSAVSSVKESGVIVNSDFEKIEKNLKTENIKISEWKNINNYALKVKDMINSQNAEKYLLTATNNLPEIYKCLKKDFCGMESSEGDPYFDDQRTPAHILMNRSLKVIQESLKENPALKILVDWNLMEDFASSGHEMLSVEALDLINQYGSGNTKITDALQSTHNFSGEARADALMRITKNATASDKKQVASEIEDVFANGDAHTVISILESIDKMQFKKESLLTMFSSLCRFNEAQINPGNWKMINLLASRLNTEFESLCQ